MKAPATEKTANNDMTDSLTKDNVAILSVSYTDNGKSATG
nr:MAG TPA: hypothetical protein [Crassvirales sp.]